MNVLDNAVLDAVSKILKPGEVRAALKAEAISAIAYDNVSYATAVLSRLLDMDAGVYVSSPRTESYTVDESQAGVSELFETYIHDYAGEKSTRPE